MTTDAKNIDPENIDSENIHLKNMDLENIDPENIDSKKVSAILTGAKQEFMTHGYAATSMDRIARAAKVSKPTLYSYFRDKAGLFTALIERLTNRNPPIISQLQNTSVLEEPPAVVLRHLAREILEQFSGEQPLFFLIRTIIGESARFPALARVFVSKNEQKIIQVVSRFLAAHPKIHLSDPEVTARIFIGTLIHHIITQEILHGRDVVPVDRERLIEGLVKLIVGSE